jgi:hypothetical protein
MRLREYDVVRLRRALPEQGLPAGAIGAVVMVLDDPPAYEVEFCDADGATLVLTRLAAADLELVTTSK